MWWMSLTVFVLWLVSGECSLDAYCGGRQTMVHLFEWTWPDIANECERYLAPAGFCAVQISPPMEHVVAQKEKQPWWQRYQPVSYKLISRSGDEDDFVDMVHRCNAVGVRIVVDAVINHMAALGRMGGGSGGSGFDADSRDFPAVPYNAEDFTPRRLCPSGDGNIHDYQNTQEVRNCYLLGLTDLYGASGHVRKTVAAYLNQLIDIGVMGFRVDAAKHMWPEDLRAIQGLTKDLNPDQGFPTGTRPYFFFEVIDMGNEPITADQYFDLGLVTEFRFGERLAQGIRDFGLLEDVYDPKAGMVPPDKAVVFVDNHDNQRNHGARVEVLTHKKVKDYTLGSSFMLAQPYGTTRVMSSYYFDNNNQGPPHYTNMSTAGVPINPDGSCGGGWVCEHRWNAIEQMVKFRNKVAGTPVQHWYRAGECVAFSRRETGFFAMCRTGTLDILLQTGLPKGSYCDLISRCLRQVTVKDDGTAQIVIDGDGSKEPLLAFCVGCNQEDHDLDVIKRTRYCDDKRTVSDESTRPSNRRKRTREEEEEGSDSTPLRKWAKSITRLLFMPESSTVEGHVENSTSPRSSNISRSSDEETSNHLDQLEDVLRYGELEMDLMFSFVHLSNPTLSLYEKIVLMFAKMVVIVLVVRNYLK
ncbi:alpha-amylase-like isoform X2 [Oratosquilla oratoria]|uniref:alpha-amylase-like isoform X2 n=1 Tax=Oratosquilla oratoria TaxID=337810 RepID=UPI003F76FAA4